MERSLTFEHLCTTSCRLVIMYGMQPRQKQKQSRAAQALMCKSVGHPRISNVQDHKGRRTYCAVPPGSCVMVVNPRWPQAGQSTGAELILRAAIGVAVW